MATRGSGDDAAVVAIVQLLAAHGVSVNARSGRNGLTAIHEAADNGQLAAVDALIGAGADVNVRDGEFGETALRKASRGYVEVVRRLI